MNFYKWPANKRRSFVIDKAQYETEIAQKDKALELRLITQPNSGLEVFANDYEYQVRFAGGYNANVSYKKSDGNAKTYWCDKGFEGVFPATNPDGSWATEKNQNTIESTQWMTREAYDFYRAYETHFPVVPKFVLNKVSDEEAQRFQWGDGPSAPFPVAQILRNDPTVNFKSTFPKDVAFRIAPDGSLEFFKISEYRAAFPITQPPLVVPGANTMPDSVFLMTVSMIMSAPETQAAKVLKIKNLAAGRQ
jgi:hypothetical protein